MAQPKTAPIGIRPPPELVAEIDAWATSRNLKRHAAILALIRRGLAGAERSTPPKPAKPKPAVAPAPAAKPASTFKPRVDTYPDWMKPKPKGAKT